MKKVFYEKVGKRYKPVKEYDYTFMSAYPKGAHLVFCKPGTTSVMYNVDPAIAPMLAAGKYAEDEMSKAIVKGLECRTPSSLKLDDRQVALWKELSASLEERAFTVNGPSARDAVAAGLNALTVEVEKMLSVPAVKLAYDHFMLVWKLTKEQQKE